MYQALYRKYRSRNFEDVYGQNIIVKILKNSITNQKIGHAYMFSGPRGTGKTTIAKIFARNVNCLNPIDGEACGKCKNCLNSFSKECVDIIEIDAASNNGVDEIRELKNKVNVVPSELKYKIYIIDEVHMLSIGAFNALLKTLEEPPEHVIFILATTDPQKVPITIISRCQCYQFKRIDDCSMLERLKKISELENFDIEDDVFQEIVSVSDGGLRDAIGLLDQLTSYKNGLITKKDFNEIYGNLVEDELEKLVEFIFENNSKEVINSIETYSSEGKNIIQIMKQLLLNLKDKLVSYYLENSDLKYNEDILIKLANQLNERMSDVKKSEDTKTYLEIFLLNFMHKNIDEQKKEIVSNTKKEKIIENSSDLSVPVIEKKESNIQNKKSENIDNSKEFLDNLKTILEEMYIRAHNTLVSASKEELNKVKENWKLLSDFTFDSNIGYIVCYLMDGTLRAANKERIILSYEYESMIEKMFPNIEQMNLNFNKITSMNKDVVLITNEQWNKLKSDFIQCKQSGKEFSTLEEKEIFQKEKSQLKEESVEINENQNSEDETLALFGDIVEIN